MSKTLEQRVADLEAALDHTIKVLSRRIHTQEQFLLEFKKELASFKGLKHNRDTMTVSEAGRKGGSAKVVKGPASLSPERRAEIAKKAAAARWKKEEAK